MSYAYLFKYIIIGDTGAGYKHDSLWIIRFIDDFTIQAWERVVCCYNSQTSVSNLSTTSPLEWSLEPG